MTIEEKAKAYDEAIENMRKFRDALSNHEETDLWVLKKEIVTDIEYYFPELKESEDEKIRKAILAFIRQSSEVLDKQNQNNMIAWLEKQGEQKPYGQRKECSDCQFNYVSECKGSCQMKKGEQKSADSYCQENCRGFQETGKCFADGDCKAKREAESVDKVEPKFNFSVGQWIVATGKCVYLITKIDGFNVTLVDVDGNEYVFDTSSLEDAHLWTIQDAKEGDVLAFYCEYKGNKMVQVGIIEKYVGKHGGCSNTFKIYVGVNWENNLIIGEYMGCPDIRPATKEQRDKLFEKMHEAEYVWDTEKKELKKIEESENIKNQIMSEITDLVKDYITQKSAKCSEEDELSCFESALFTAFSDAWQSYLLGEEVNVKQWTKEHSKELLEAAKEELKGHNSARSEEDEGMIKSICEGLQDASNEFGWSDFGQTSIDSIIDWLKSFKDRIIA